MKRLGILFLILFCFSCTSTPKPAPLPPTANVDTEFVLTGYQPGAGLKDLTEDLLRKKKAVYSALKRLNSNHNVVIVYDASGSMTAKLPGMSLKRYEAAYEGLRKIGNLFSREDNVWLIVFGSKKPFGIIQDGTVYRKDYMRAVEAGNDVEVVFSSKDKGFDEKTFLESITYLESEKAYIGDTPIGYSILKAHEILKGLPNSKVILISDGEETGPLLAETILKSKAWEQRIRAKYPHLDDITISAEEGIKRLVADGASFNPIIYGVMDQAIGGPSDKGNVQSVRAFYRKMASASGSVYLEAVTPLELLNAFMDAEMMSVAYSLYSTEDRKKGGPVARGKVGVPITVKEGSYRLRTESEQPFESSIEAKPGEKNTYIFDIDDEGRLKIVRAKG